GLAHPLPDRGLGQVKVAGDLPDRAVTVLAQLDDLGLELGRERPARPRLLAFHGLHDGHPLRGDAPDGGCPSKRAKPRHHRRGPQLTTQRSIYLARPASATSIPGAGAGGLAGPGGARRSPHTPAPPPPPPPTRPPPR